MHGSIHEAKNKEGTRTFNQNLDRLTWMTEEPTTRTVKSSSILTLMAMLKWNANFTEEQEQTCGNCMTSDQTSSGFQAQDIDQARSRTSPKQTWKSVFSWKSSR